MTRGGKNIWPWRKISGYLTLGPLRLALLIILVLVLANQFCYLHIRTQILQIKYKKSEVITQAVPP
jgi:hypothetical protein